MNGAVIFGIFFYMIVMLIIGYWSSKRIKILIGFLVARRNWPYFLEVRKFLTFYCLWAIL